MNIDPSKLYYCSVAVVEGEGDEERIVNEGKAFASFSNGQWILSKVYFAELLDPEHLYMIHVQDYVEYTSEVEVPNLEKFVHAAQAVKKSADFENKLGLIIDTLEDMITQLFGGSVQYFEAMQAAGYLSFDALEPLPKFAGSNMIFNKPKEWDGRKGNVRPLAAHFNPQTAEIISVWKSISPAHRLRFFLDGLISLTVHARALPPVSVSSGFFPNLDPNVNKPQKPEQ